MDPLSLLIIGGGLLAQHMGTQQATRRAEQMRGAMEQYQRQKAQQNEQAINQMLGQQTADARAKELQGITTSREGTMQSTVDAARAASPVTQVAGTNTSPDYQKASEAAATRVSDKTKRAIQQLAVMGAPGEQGVTSGIRFGRTAGNVDANNMAIANVGEGYTRDMNNVAPNPWLMLAGRAAVGAGAGMALGGGAVPASAAAMGADRGGNFSYEDSAGNTQPSAFPYRTRRAWPKGWGG